MVLILSGAKRVLHLPVSCDGIHDLTSTDMYLGLVID